MGKITQTLTTKPTKSLENPSLMAAVDQILTNVALPDVQHIDTNLKLYC